ncbi:type II toxin-antitoxin system Phd/YefM family antitoxin [Corynebacterium guaraldiae]
MTRISLRELTQRSDHIVRAVAATGHNVIITDRDQAIVRIVPISSPDSPVKQLVAAGILSHAPEPYSQPAATAPQPRHTDNLRPGTDIISLLDRDDRL